MSLKKEIYVGGVAGIETLMDAASSTTYRFNGGGIYLHGTGWGHLNTNQRKAVFHANCGSPFIVGIGWSQGEAHDRAWYARYIERYKNIGIDPKYITCNVFAKGRNPTLERWKSYCKDFRDGGFNKPMYPEFEYANYIANPNRPVPNRKKTLIDNMVSKSQYFQSIIHFSKGLIIDTAGKFFFKCPQEYRDWIVDAIKWAKKHNYYVGCYASPYMAQDQYEEHTVKMIKYYETKNAEPDAYIIANYRDPEPLGYETVVGREWIRDTCLGLGHYLVNEYYRDLK